MAAEHGPNELASAPRTLAWVRLARQFAGLLVGILIVAAAVSMALGEWVDALAIIAILVLNAVLGFVQEEKAERSLESLRKLSAPTTKVLRDGHLQEVAAAQLVPGDIVQMESGDFVPADARLLHSFSLQTQEAALTGESAPVEKDAGPVLPPETPLGDRRNMIYMGTVISAGKATAIVVATGMRTELGHIAGLIQQADHEPTPLQRRLGELGRVLIVICLAIVGIILVLRLLRGDELFEVFMMSVGLAVAAVPEGLPTVVTIALALGLQRMVRRNALIRRLPSVETLGSVTVICSDKTGTLTRNEMTVREILAGGRWFAVRGVGYVPQGEFVPHESEPDTNAAEGTPLNPHDDDDLPLLLEAGAWCGSARLESDNGAWKVVGDPTEGALLVAARKAGIERNAQRGRVVHEVPFESQRKAMSVVVESDSGLTVYTKGAPEAVLKRCSRCRQRGEIVPLDDRIRQEILESNSGMAARALRVLGIAYRPVSDSELDIREQGHPSEDAVESDLIFLGLAGMIDPPRDEVRRAVATCRRAGIKPVMITGDHPATAIAVARELDIASGDEKAVSGQDLQALSDEELTQRADAISVYARVTAADKLRIVKAWQARQQVVAMTGDGVNDAPAVKAADIGIAMGITGTDVTKEASDMVLTDDNFASIVNAVEEGRGIFDNIQKFIIYLLSCNASEIVLVFIAAAVGWPTPLKAVQLLWINLVTDGLPALALAMEPPEPDIMRRQPRPPREPVITLGRGVLILSQGALMAAAAIGGFWWFQREGFSLDETRTAVFSIVAYTQLCFSLACRSQRYTMPELGLFTNAYLLSAIVLSGLVQFAVVSLVWTRRIFEAVPLSGVNWAVIGGLSLIPVSVVEIGKLIWKAFRGGRSDRAQPGSRAGLAHT